MFKIKHENMYDSGHAERFCYLSSGWFKDKTPNSNDVNAQERTRLTVYSALAKHKINIFSPKDEAVVGEEGAPIGKKILDANIAAIDAATFCIVNTEGKDMGTLFEAGYAYAHHIPIIYYWEHADPTAKFNLMLAFSGVTVCSTEKELNDFLDLLIKEDFNFAKCEKEYEGNIE